MKPKSNPELIALIDELKVLYRENKAPVWRDLAKRLEKPLRNYAKVNLSRINRYSKESDIIAVPGKVLGGGSIAHPITVAALGFTTSAEDKIKEAKGTCISLRELMDSNPTGSNVKIMR